MTSDPTLPCPLDAAAARRPNALFLLRADGSPVRYAGTAATAGRLAGVLKKRWNVCEGDRVALLTPTTPELPALWFALFRIGAVVCPINLRLPVAAVRERLDLLNPAMVVGGAEGPALADICAAAEGGGALDERARLDPNRPATVVFTSGSSGRPKAVVHTLGNHLRSAEASNAHAPLGEEDRWLLSLPLYHVGGLAVLFRCVLAGASVVLPGSDAEPTGTIQSRGVTHLSLVPTQLQRLLAAGISGSDVPSLKRILLGGGPIPRDLVRCALRRDLPVAASYGMTETASQVAAVPPDADSGVACDTDGTVLPHSEIRISEKGEIQVRGGSVSPGVWRRGRVQSFTDDDGWLSTGDRGRLEEHGGLVVEGRCDRMFISGGENIQPEEIERELSRIIGGGAVVVPVEDEVFGMRPAAWVDAPVTDGNVDAWRAALRSRLPGYMIPVRFRRFPEERTGLKPDLEQLRRRMAAPGDPS